MDKFRIPFEDQAAIFADPNGVAPCAPWSPVVIDAESIDAEVARLSTMPRPGDGRRASLIVHPRASAGSPGLAPGIEITLWVLNPGEATTPFRHNATEINFCIRGKGRIESETRTVSFEQQDVWNIPSFTVYSRVNDSDEPLVGFTYSNAPLLRFMQVYLSESPDRIEQTPRAEGGSGEEAKSSSPYGTFVIGDDGAALMPYEKLINPPPVTSELLHWPWKRVEAELNKLESLGRDYVGRRLYLLFNPMTGRTNGTTPNFFATMTIRPPNIVDRPHRHVSAAINYYFRGAGRSAVAGNSYEWRAGDLMLAAPGWTVHNHASYDEHVYELTIQDQPLNIVMESLLWQEDMKRPPALLGVERGFDTNREHQGA